MLKPQSSASREVLPLDGLWNFKIDPGSTGFDQQWWTRGLVTSREAPVPASYNEVFADKEVRDHVGWVWYQREIRVPHGWGRGRIFIYFESITHEGVVFVNDVEVARHVGGYTPFETDVTDFLDAGGNFRLTVAVNNVLTNETIPPGEVVITPAGSPRQNYRHDFYNYAGIARSVKLYQAPNHRILDIDVDTSFVGTVGLIEYSVRTTAGGDVRVVVRDAEGKTCAAAAGSSGTLRIDDVNLWQPGAGYLYTLSATATTEDGEVDEYALQVGVRTVRVSGEYFLINDEPFYFRGFGKHEDSPVRGKGHDNVYMVHDFELMRWTGANSFRTAHYPYSEDVMDYADRHGIVVIDETPAVGLNVGIAGALFGGERNATFSPTRVNSNTREAHAQALRELIDRDKNHPSVVMWSLANEPASNEPGAREYFEPLVTLARALDPSRPITSVTVMLSRYDEDRITDLFDVICLNRYYGWYVDLADLQSAELNLEAELRGWADRFDKPIIVTEYGADTLPGLRSVFDEPWTEEYQIEFLKMNHRVFDKLGAVVGEHVWNFADFQTGPAVFRVGGNRKGVFTRDRHPKAAAYTLRERWRGPDMGFPSDGR